MSAFVGYLLGCAGLGLIEATTKAEWSVRIGCWLLWTGLYVIVDQVTRRYT